MALAREAGSVLVTGAARAAAIAVLMCAFAAIFAGTANASGRVLWGAYFGGTQYGLADAPWSMKSVARFQAEVGKKASLVHFSLPWYTCHTTCASVPFPAPQMSAIRSAGKIPVVSWNSYSQPVSESEPSFELRDIINGDYDKYIRHWAAAAKKWRHPFFLRFDREMNLNCCYPYVEGKNGNASGQFVSMWRHVRSIFRSAGVKNVTWIWSPNVAYPGSTPLREVYPGRRYVNWTGLDGYNWGTNPVRPIGWRSFKAIFAESYRSITRSIAPQKVMMIGETATTESGGSKATWINRMLTRSLPNNFPRIRAVLYYNAQSDGVDWPIESSRSATTAFRKAIGVRHYLGNRFAHLHESPIRPPF